MLAIKSSDVVKNPSLITNPKDITFVDDAKKHITKSVVLPYEFYKLIQEEVENKLYLYQNKDALSQKSYEEFLEIEDSFAEDLTIN